MSVAMATMFAMSIRIVTTQMVLTFVLARKDTLEMDSHVKVNKSSLHYLKQAALNINYRPWKLTYILETCFYAPLIFLLRSLLYITYASRYRRMQQWKPWLRRKCELYQH